MVKRVFLVLFILSFILCYGCGKSGEQKTETTSGKKSELNFKEGKWEVTVTIEAPGMPVQMPPQTSTVCLTQQNYIPQQQESEQSKCKIIKTEKSGDTVSWITECEDKEGKMFSNGQMTYKYDSFEGFVKIKIPKQGEMTQKMKGKWIGPC